MATSLHCWESSDSGGTTAVNNLDVTKPTSGSTAGPAGAKNAAAGDTLIILVGNDDATATAQWDDSTLKPTGFTLINEVGDATADAHCAAFWRTVDGTEGSTFNVPAQSTNDMWAFCILLSGIDNTTPVHQTGADVSDNTPPIAITGVTTTIADCLAFYVCAYDGGDDGGFSVSGTGWSELAEEHAGTGVNNASGCCGTRQMSGTGATGTATVAVVVSDGTVGFQFALAPGNPLTTRTPDSGAATATGTTPTVQITAPPGSGIATATVPDHTVTIKVFPLV